MNDTLDRIERLYNNLPWNDEWGSKPVHSWRALPKRQPISPPADESATGTSGRGGEAMPDLPTVSRPFDLYH